MESALGSALAARREAVLASCACTNLRKATRVVTQRFDRALKPSGVSANQLALLLACAAPDETTIAAVADALAADRTTLTRTLRPLARRGLIDIGRGPDRRERRIRITARGRDTLAEALPLWAAAEREFATALGWETIEGLLGTLARIVATRDDR